MKIQCFKIHQPPIKNHGDGVIPVIDDTKWRHRPGGDAYIFLQPFRTSKRQAADTEYITQGLQVYFAIFERCQQEHFALFVAQEQILGMRPNQPMSMGFCFFNRVDSRMRHGRCFDTKVV